MSRIVTATAPAMIAALLVAGVVSAGTAIEAAPGHIMPGIDTDGWVSQYAPGLMDRVVEQRMEWGQMPTDVWDYDIRTAVLDCAYIGYVGSVLWHDTHTTESVIVTDCACRCHPTTINWFTRDDIIIEVDYETAERHDFVGRGGKKVTVLLYGHWSDYVVEEVENKMPIPGAWGVN